MDFRRLSEWKHDQLRMALEENNIKELEYLRKKKDSSLLSTLFHTDFATISLPMMDIFVNKFTDENWERWGAKPDMRNDLGGLLMGKSMQAGHADQFDLFFNAGLDLNKGQGKSHVINGILLSKMPDETKTDLVNRIAARGLDKVSDRQELARTAHVANAPAAFDLLAGLSGLDIHKDNELLLRSSARAGHETMAEHLVVKHGADLRLAITTEKTLGNEKSASLLDTLRLKLNPEEEAAPTIESLSTEMRALKALVHELTAEVRNRDLPEKTIGKSVVRRPTLP